MTGFLSGGARTPGAAPQMSPQQKAQMANDSGRQALLGTGIAMSQLVWRGAALSLGQATRLDLLRVGITTGVELDFTLSLDISATMTASPAGPWVAMNNIVYTDFSGVNRVMTTGLALWLLASLKLGKLFNNAIAGNVAAIGEIDTDIITHPTATGATQVVYFSLYVPMAYEPGKDLRGAVPSMVNVGEHYLTLTPTGAVVNANDCLLSPYTAGTATVNSFTVDVTQFYIQPQSLNVSMLPGIDLTTIYELNGNNITTSGFLSNSQNLINYPNDRAVMSAIHVFENGGTLTVNGTDLTLVELLVNSNTVFRQWTPRALRAFMREHTQGDVPAGCYYFPSRRQPFLTNLYATIQVRYTLGTINSGVTKIVSQYESVYPSGSPLSGITPNAG